MSELAYTIGVLVTRPELYAEMRRSFEEAGFGDDCEYVAVDNTGGIQTDAYRALNDILCRARGRRVILCHQDVFVVRDGRAELDARLDELTWIDPFWAVAGNAGVDGRRRSHIRISDKFGSDQRVGGPFPARVQSLDENFLVVRPEARLAFSRDLSGFHLYASDLCLVADILGWHCYVIDFHLRHTGEGTTGEPFRRARREFRAKWSRAFRDRHMVTPSTSIFLTGQRRPPWYLDFRSWLCRRLARLRQNGG